MCIDGAETFWMAKIKDTFMFAVLMCILDIFSLLVVRKQGQVLEAEEAFRRCIEYV